MSGLKKMFGLSNNSGNTMKNTKQTNERLEKLNNQKTSLPRQRSSSLTRQNTDNPNQKRVSLVGNNLVQVEQQVKLRRQQSKRQALREAKEILQEELKQDENNEKKKKRKKKVKINMKFGDETYTLYDYYKPIKELGKGAYAIVIEVEDSRTSEHYAIKKNKGVFDQLSDAKRILRELKLLSHFNHPNVLPIVSVIPPDVWERDEFQDVYLVLPRMDTNLRSIIRNEKFRLKIEQKQYFVYQMLLGTLYIHKCGVYHRDLKPENLLINLKTCKLKITDFGLARGVMKENDEMLTQYVVTRWYRAPEVICNVGRYTEAVDTWAIGCIMLELWTRKPFFRGNNYMDQLQRIFSVLGKPESLDILSSKAKNTFGNKHFDKPKPLTKLINGLDQTAGDLLTKLLKVDVKQRIVPEEGLKHPWLSKYFREKDIKYANQAVEFDIEFETEQKMKTKFGVRHLMYEELINWKKNQLLKLKQREQRQQPNKKHTTNKH